MYLYLYLSTLQKYFDFQVLVKYILLIELVCNLEHRNMDMIMFSPNVTHNNYYSDYTYYINGIRELRFAQFMERQVQYCCLIGNALY